MSFVYVVVFWLVNQPGNILHFSKAIKSANRRTHNHILSVCSCAWLNSAERFFLEKKLAKTWDCLPTFNERILIRYQSWTLRSARKPCKGKTKGMKKTLSRYLFYYLTWANTTCDRKLCKANLLFVPTQQFTKWFHMRASAEENLSV